MFADHLAATFLGDDRCPVDDRARELQTQVSSFCNKSDRFSALPVGDPRRKCKVQITRSEIRWATRRLKMKAPELDDVPNIILKHGGTALHRHLR